ncbi:3TM-type holin [Microbulbifer sp. CnH-101-E]|uniref:3TM-type holin n=1 Tax=unclassified Microbulbifer TaxID=2619833 RepID=UPI0040393630
MPGERTSLTEWSYDPLTAIFDAGTMAIERSWPDPVKCAGEVQKLEELKQRGSLVELNTQIQLLLGQLEVNKAEAQHKSIFVAGWRLWIGWVGVWLSLISLFYIHCYVGSGPTTVLRVQYLQG